MEEFVYQGENESSESLFQKNTSRLCMCECSECSSRSPHPVYNCYKDCEVNEKLTEKEKLLLGVYRKCTCTCPFCLTCDKSHSTDDCMKRCISNTFRRL